MPRCVVVREIGNQTAVIEFDSHCVPNIFGFALNSLNSLLRIVHENIWLSKSEKKAHCHLKLKLDKKQMLHHTIILWQYHIVNMSAYFDSC